MKKHTRGRKILNVTGGGATLFKSATYLQKTPFFKVIEDARMERITNIKAEKNRNFCGDWE